MGANVVGQDQWSEMRWFRVRRSTVSSSIDIKSKQFAAVPHDSTELGNAQNHRGAAGDFPFQNRPDGNSGGF
jgi:hypothetical protein